MGLSSGAPRGWRAFAVVNSLLVFDAPPIIRFPMPPSTSPHRAPRRRRPQPPLPGIVGGAEAFPGLPVLEELPGGLGVVLWQASRNLVLWAATPVEARHDFFGGAAAAVRQEHLAEMDVDGELVGPLAIVTRLMEHPTAPDVPRLVHACRRITAWAERRGALATALEFAQAAALVDPASPRLAYDVGRLARRGAQYDRAESWYLRAVTLGRREEDWESYARAFSGLGNLHAQRGNFPAARRAALRCLRAARRHRIRSLVGSAAHSLFSIGVEMGSDQSLEPLAEQAFVAYGPGHPKLPRLAYDVAFHWASEGYFAQALGVARALLPHFPAGPERAFCLGLVARAAGGTGRSGDFHAARDELLALVAQGGAGDAEHRALLGVALGAASLREWPMAVELAGRVLQTARVRQEGQVVMLAEAALDASGRHVAMAARSPEPGTVTDTLAPRFIGALAAQAAEAGGE
jgi:tetratricopeptide (TPR) repeat protein